MVLYCVDNPVWIGYVIMHKYGKKNDDAALVVDRKIFDERGLIRSLKQLKINGIFSEIYFMDMYFNLFQGRSEKEYERYCIDYYDNQFDKLGIELKKIEKIYTINDGWEGLINLYFNLKKQKYYWISGRSKLDVLVEISDIKGDASFLELIKKYKFLTPFAEFAIPEMQADTKSMYLERLQKKYEVWDKKQCMENIDIDTIDKIVQAYGVSDVEEEKYLFVANSYGAYFGIGEYLPNVKRMIGCSMYLFPEVFSYMHKTLFDYFFDLNDKIYYKAHPNDPVSSSLLQDLYDNKLVNLTNAPFELAQKYLVNKNVKFKGIIGFDSSAFEMIDSRLFQKRIIIGREFVKTWYYYDSLFTAMNMAKYLNRDIYSDGIDYSQMVKLNDSKFNNLLNIYEDGQNATIEKAIIIVNAIIVRKEGKKLEEYIYKYGSNNIVLFLNCELAEYFFENRDDIKDWLCPICIDKTETEEHRIKLYRDEVIWVYTHGGMLHRKISDFSLEYFLNNLKIKVNAYQPKPTIAMDMCMKNMLISQIKNNGC